MLSKSVREWLSEYKGLTDVEIHTFACTVRENKPLIDSLYVLFDAKPSIEELDPVCHQLFEFYRSREEHLKRFALELIPSLIGLYLRCLSYNDKKTCGGLEAFLLGVYNLEIVQSDGSPKMKTFRIPTINQGSIYHEPVQLSSLALTESTLNRYNRPAEEWRGGPYPQYESINSQNRQAVLSQLLQVYNADIAQLASHSHHALCLAASKISTTGLPSLQVSPPQLQSWPNTNGPRPKTTSPRHSPRMTVSPALLVEMLWGINFAMYNGCDKVARDAVRDVHARACFELLPDVQLVTEALLNSDSLALGGMGDGGPMGIAIPSTSHTSLSKTTLTNASFKTKKLPDDIPMASEAESQEPQAHSSKLSPIEEEHKGLAKQVLRLSKGRKKEDKEEKKQQRSKEARKDSDTSSNKSLVLNGDNLDSVSVSVVKNQTKVTVDNLELRQLTKRYSEDHPLTNGNNSASRRNVSDRRQSGDSTK
ncbi:hyccin-like isoform X2 [Babylonia areolata]|uniref:hyccin-like isoform X2 n=1 Tax=Babylonia areolata TaxID=304850 RepID=UPI003FD63B10